MHAAPDRTRTESALDRGRLAAYAYALPQLHADGCVEDVRGCVCLIFAFSERVIVHVRLGSS